MSTERVAGHHRSRAEVEDLLRDYAATGLSRREFCHSRGVGLSTLGHYLKRSRLESVVSQPQFVAVELCRAKAAEPLVQRAGSPPAMEPKWSSGLAVVLTGGRRIEVQRGFDGGVLEQLVRVLERV